MAVAFDAVGGGATKTSSPWTITWSHTAAGGANCVVLISFAATPTLTNTSSTKAGWPPGAVTYGGVTASLVAYDNVGTADSNGVIYTFALWNPPTGAQTVSVSLPNATALLHGNSVSYTGASRIVQAFHAGGSSTAPSITVATVSGRYYHHVQRLQPDAALS
jgi:hypothetical protein